MKKTLPPQATDAPESTSEPSDATATKFTSKTRGGRKAAVKPRKKNVSASQWLTREKRKALLDKLLEEFLALHKEAMESVKSDISDPIKRVEALTRLSQALDRTLNALVKATPQTPRLAIAQEVLKHQVDFVEASYPEHAAALLEVLTPFGEKLVTLFAE